mgnify:CR=1
MIIYASTNNPGAKEVAQMLRRSLPELEITKRSPSYDKKLGKKLGSALLEVEKTPRLGLGVFDSAVNARPRP